MLGGMLTFFLYEVFFLAIYIMVHFNGKHPNSNGCSIDFDKEIRSKPVNFSRMNAILLEYNLMFFKSDAWLYRI